METYSKLMQKEGFGVGVTILGNRCSRCGYEWVPHNFKDIPETCPDCRSPYWNKPKIRFKKGEKKK
jgi:predicted Zn-ribbon and HTH transcriptional regulator